VSRQQPNQRHLCAGLAQIGLYPQVVQCMSFNPAPTACRACLQALQMKTSHPAAESSPQPKRRIPSGRMRHVLCCLRHHMTSHKHQAATQQLAAQQAPLGNSACSNAPPQPAAHLSTLFLAQKRHIWLVPLRIMVGVAPLHMPRRPSSRRMVVAQWMGFCGDIGG
jgi:hypothetical protein